MHLSEVKQQNTQDLCQQDEYDVAGFAVGVVDRKDLITGENIKPGDTLIGIASSGVHI